MSISASRYHQDTLYQDVLTSVSDRNCSQDVLTFFRFSNAAFPLYRSGGTFMLAEILGYDEAKISTSLRDLKQVTTLPSYDDTDVAPEDLKGLLRVLPSDFQEYLIDKARSGIFYLDPQTAYDQLTRTFLMHLPSVLSTAHETSFPTMLLVSRLLVSSCIKIIQANEDLWTDLFELDLDAYLHLLRQSAFPQWEIHEQASRLLTWIKEQDARAMNVLGFTRSMFIYYREGWDRRVSSSLRPLTADRQASNIITALQHPYYLSSGPELYVNMAQILRDVNVRQQSTGSDCVITPIGMWILGGQVSKDSAFLAMLLEYLDDSNRSGEFWNVQDRFLSVSETIIKFLFTHQVPLGLKGVEERQLRNLYRPTKKNLPATTRGTYIYALRWLPPCLDKATYSNKLARYLDSNTLEISPRLPEKIIFEQAVMRYKSKKYPNTRRWITIPSLKEMKLDY